MIKKQSAFPLNPEHFAPMIDIVGLYKREYYAAAALQGICANSIPGTHHQTANKVREAVELADALIQELEK